MIRVFTSLILLLCAASSASAATWIDPSFEQMIALTDGAAVLSSTGQPGPAKTESLSFEVKRTLYGPKLPTQIHLNGFYDPKTEDLPKIPKGQEFVAFFFKKQGYYKVPTPTMGFFPIKDEQVLACVRDTSIRVRLKLSQFERFTKIIAQTLRAKTKIPSLWLKIVRKRVDGSDILALSEAQATKLHLNLEALYYAASAEDFKRAQRCLGCGVYQVRISACRVLGRIETDKAALLLLDTVLKDKIDSVRNWAAMALARRSSLPSSIHEKLLECLSKASNNEIRLHRSISDPRMNALPGARNTLLQFAGKIRLKKAQATQFEALDSKEAETIEAGLNGLVQFKDQRLIGRIIEHMRTDDSDEYPHNRLFMRALRKLSGQKLGLSRRDWQKWWLKNRDRISQSGDSGTKRG